jgi:predicted transcriptional regulator
MKRVARRDKIKIYGDLLTILNAESKSTERIVLTRVQAKLNVPFDRLKCYISDLDDLDLIEDPVSCKLTQKGKQYLSEYTAILDFMERMGITYR